MRRSSTRLFPLFFLACLLSAGLLGPSAAWGGKVYGCSCYCNKNLPCDEITDLKCMQLCGDAPSSGSSGNVIRRVPDRTRQKTEERLRRQREQRKRLLEKLRKAEEEDRRRKEEARKQFLKQNREVVNSLKGLEGGTLNIKGGKIRKTLGIKTSADVTLKTGGKRTGSVASAWKQLYCGADISGFAIRKANPRDGRSIDIEEIRYLTDQANKAFSGEELEVKCSKVPARTAAYSQVKIGQNSPLVRFYRRLLAANMQEASEAWDVSEKVRIVRKKKKKADENIRRLKAKIERLELKAGTDKPKTGKPEVEKTKDKPRSSTSGSNDAGKEKKDDSLSTLIAKARAALKASKKVSAEASETIASAEAARSKSRKSLKKYEGIFNKVEKKPTLAGDFIDQVPDLSPKDEPE